MATYSNILAWKIPMSLAGCSPWGLKESDTTEHAHHISKKGIQQRYRDIQIFYYIIKRALCVWRSSRSLVLVRLKMYTMDFIVLRSPSNIKNKNRNVNSIFKEPKRHQ